MSKRAELLSKIVETIKDYPPKNISDLSRKTGIRWETVRNRLQELQKIGAVEFNKNEKKYYWCLVPYRFFERYKENKESYIHSLEMRLLELKWKK